MSNTNEKEEKEVVIIRGCSGSGKSTYIEQNYSGAIICSADNFFEERAMLNGTSYEEEFQPWLLSRAHQSCWAVFIHAVAVRDEKLVVVDNTNICGWEFENYETLAKALGYKVTIVNMPMNEPAEVYHKRNKHGVPLEAIQRMINSFEL
jgi:predicted kinase